MLDHFFSLNGQFEEQRKYENEAEFYDQLDYSKDFRNALFMPDVLGKKDDFTTKKIIETNFTNFSFRRTNIFRITFLNCTFIDCLFPWCRFENCEFINCKFESTNFHKCEFIQCLADPE